MSSAFHIPVLREESLQLLRVQPGGRYIDCTLGTGGHATAILERISPAGQLLGIDADPKAVEIAADRLKPFGKAALLVTDNFKNLKTICTRLDFPPVQGILFDLGISSYQLEDIHRGFSFMLEAPLDMRFSPLQELTAADIVNNFSPQELALLLKKYGEETCSHKIARHIIANRPILTSRQLARVIEETFEKRRGRIHPATRSFQALRIAVNQELENLDIALRQSINLLASGGRLVVISYHSLEDRLTKELLRQESQGCLCPPGTPLCRCGHSPTLRLVNKKVITPSAAERQSNPRSRSAKMRAAERM